MNSETDSLEVQPEHLLERVRHFLTCFVQWVRINLKDKLNRTAWRILGNATDADDALQKTLKKCWEEWPQIKSNPEGWVMMVHANHCRDQCRERKRQAVLKTGVHLSENLEPGFEPSNAVDGSDVLAFAINAKALSDGERKVISLQYGKGISRAAIAKELAISVTRVKQIHDSAIAKLKRAVNRKAQLS